MARRRGYMIASGLAGAGLLAGLMVRARKILSEAQNIEPSGAQEHVAGADAFEVSTSDGAKIYGISFGEGEPAYVFSHCWGGSTATWMAVARRVAQAGRRVVLYDQRGHGKSTAGSAPFTVETLRDDLRRVLEFQELSSPILAGHSMGGMAVQAALIDPSFPKVRAAALVATTAKSDPRAGGFLEAASAVVKSPVTDLMLSNGLLAPLLVRPVTAGKVSYADLNLIAQSFKETDREIRAEFLRSFKDLDLSGELPKVSVPVLVVGGAEDRLTPPRAAALLANLIPEAELRILEGCGHMIPLEKPDLLAELLLEL